MVNGAAYTEVLRRITQSIWDGERGLLISTLYLFSFIIIVNFLLNMIPVSYTHLDYWRRLSVNDKKYVILHQTKHQTKHTKQK